MRAGRRLKLGDFGIVRQQSDRRGITARTHEPADRARATSWPAPRPSGRRATTSTRSASSWACWSRATRSARIRTAEIRGLPCSDHLKEIVYRCIGERRKRYESADELIDALRNPPAPLKAGVLRSLKGVHLAFTGILTQAAARRRRGRRGGPGAIVHGGPSVRTTVVVRGPPEPAAGGRPRRRA